MGIYNWVRRFSQEAINKVKDFKPVVGDTWIADETVLKVGGKNVWFFDVIDEKTRYLLASRLSESRATKGSSTRRDSISHGIKGLAVGVEKLSGKKS